MLLDKSIKVIGRIKRYYKPIVVASGILVIIIGILIFTGDLAKISAMMI